MNIVQRVFGILNKQTVVNNNIVLDDKYLKQLLKFENNPSDVNQVVLSLYNVILEDVVINEKRNMPPEIQDKLNHNNVVSYKPLIETHYSENGYYLDAAYEALDSDTPGRKKAFLNYINSIYQLILGNYLKNNPGIERLELIRANADNIIIEVVNNLLIRIANHPKSIEHISSESIEYNIIAIVCHAFVDCKVLENPNNT
jgi:hypothetical protein